MLKACALQNEYFNENGDDFQMNERGGEEEMESEKWGASSNTGTGNR